MRVLRHQVDFIAAWQHQRLRRGGEGGACGAGGGNGAEMLGEVALDGAWGQPDAGEVVGGVGVVEIGRFVGGGGLPAGEKQAVRVLRLAESYDFAVILRCQGEGGEARGQGGQAGGVEAPERGTLAGFEEIAVFEREGVGWVGGGDQLDFGVVGEFDVGVADAVGVWAAGFEGEAEAGEVGLGQCEVGHGNGDVIQAGDHGGGLCLAGAQHGEVCEAAGVAAGTKKVHFYQRPHGLFRWCCGRPGAGAAAPAARC